MIDGDEGLGPGWVSCWPSSWRRRRSPGPPRRGWRSPGLREPVEIVRDRWGIAHIYARSEHDLFLAQGYNAARDRLFQLELWRRRATGTMAEIQGPGRWPPTSAPACCGSAATWPAELDHYHPRGAAIVGAFVRGINAYIERTEREPARLPVEFRILGIKPGRWTPEVVVSRHNGLYRNVTQEVEYAQLVRLLGRGPRPGAAQPAPRPSRGSSPTRRSTCRSSPTRSSRPTGPRGAPVRFRPEDVGPEFRADAARSADRPPGDRRRRPIDRPVAGHAIPTPRAATTGRSPARGRPPAPRSWPTTRTAACCCRRSATGSTSSRPAGTSSAPASRPCPASRSAITSTAPGDSPSSRSTRKTFTSTRPTPRTRRATATAADGRRCGRSARPSR